MFKQRELTLLSPGSRIVVLYPGERERFFEHFLGCPVGDGTCWVSIGEKSRMSLEDLGYVAGLYDVTGQSCHPRNVVDLEQIRDAPSDDDIRTLVESARDEPLIERRRRNDLMCLRLDCCHASWVLHVGVVLLSTCHNFTRA